MFCALILHLKTVTYSRWAERGIVTKHEETIAPSERQLQVSSLHRAVLIISINTQKLFFKLIFGKIILLCYLMCCGKKVYPPTYLANQKLNL